MKKSAQICWLFFFLSFISLLGSRILIGHWIEVMWIPLLGILVFGLGAVFLDFRYIKESLNSYKFKQVSRVGVRALALLGIIVLMGNLVFRFVPSWDISFKKMNSISEEAHLALGKIDKNIIIHAFFQKDQDLATKENFRLFSKKVEMQYPQISFQFIDAASQPKMVERYGIKKIPSFVVTSSDRDIVLNSWSEELIVNTITKVYNNQDYRVCNMTGFGEMSSKSSELYSIAHWAQLMKESGYVFSDISEVEFVRNALSCDLLLLAAPKQAYPLLFLQKLEEYFLKARPVLIALDPGKSHNLSPFLKKFDVQYYNNYVIDIAGEKAGFNAATVIGSEWNANTKLGSWLSGKAVVFPAASQMEILDENKSLSKKMIVGSSKDSFAKPALKEELSFRPGVDAEGSFPIGVLVEGNGNRMAVFSDGDFISNEYIAFQGNRELANRLLSFLIRSEEDINVAPKSFYREKFVLTPIYAKSFLLVGIMPVPFLLFGFSFWIWFRRRRL